MASKGNFEAKDDKSFYIREFETDPSWINGLGPEFLDYRKKWEQAEKEHRLFGFPLFLEVESTYACNYNCVMCPRGALDHRSKAGELPTELFDKLFAEAREKGLASINLSHGGEPLLHRNIVGLVKRSKEAGILDIMIHTNASLLTKERSRMLIEAGLTKINFSLDAASRETYEKVRKGGSYERVMKNIGDFLEAKKEFGKSYPRVRVSFVVMDENRHEMQSFLDQWKDKVNVVAFQQFRDYSKEADAAVPKEYDCSSIWHLLMVSEDGSIMPCIEDYRHDIVLGNLKTHTIGECWNGEKMQELRKKHLEGKWNKIPMCRRCVSNAGEL